MAGGTWSATEMPVLPGLYLNFQAAALAAIQAGARGVVAVPVKANWGPVRQFVEITNEAGIIQNYTASVSDGATAYTALRFALMGGAKKVLAYRLTGTNAHAAEVVLADSEVANALKLVTKYPTDRSFKVTVKPSLTAGKTEISLFESETLLKTFSFVSGPIQNAVDAINTDPGNQWLVASKVEGYEGNVALATVNEAVAFTLGNNGIAGVAAGDYTNALTAFETQEFNILTLDGVTDEDLQDSVIDWVKRVRNEGKGIILVLGGSATADDVMDTTIARSTSQCNYEGVVNVGTGVVLNKVNYYSAQVAPYVAGLIAGQKLSESTTYAPTPFDDVTRRWTRSEQEKAVQNGVFLLVHDGRMVKALRGMNSLVTLRQGQNNTWKKIRAIRVMDAINADLLRAAEDNYIGKVNNTAEGRLALIGACKQYMVSLVQGGVIEAAGWDVYLDPVYYGPNPTKTPESDQVYLKWEARLTDVMELILGTFIVK